MKVTRIWQVVEIRIIPGEPCDYSRIRHQVAPSLALQNDSNARLHRAARAPYARNIYSTLLQGVQCDVSEIVVPDARLKTHTAVQSSEIVPQNCGRSSQSQRHPVGNSSRSRGNSSGTPLRIKSRLTSPAIVTSKPGIVRPCLYSDNFCFPTEQTPAQRRVSLLFQPLF